MQNIFEKDINSLDFESNEQTMNEKKSRDNCLNIVKDLTSPQSIAKEH